MFISSKKMLIILDDKIELEKENAKLEHENIRLKDELAYRVREAYKKECRSKKEVTQDKIKRLYDLFIAKENSKLKLYTDALELNKAQTGRFFENLYYNNNIFEFLDFLRTKGYTICKAEKGE